LAAAFLFLSVKKYEEELEEEYLSLHKGQSYLVGCPVTVCDPSPEPL
jgi:hypothetical protein